MLDLAAATVRLETAKARAVDWLLRHVGADGRPQGAELSNGWSRLPWIFALAGETAAGHAVLTWAEKQALDSDGGFRVGPALGNGRWGAYPIGHMAMGAMLLERRDLYARLIGKLGTMQVEGGGFPIEPAGTAGARVCELMSTAQAGIVAELGGCDAIADGVYRWIKRCYDEQPALPKLLYTAQDEEGLLTDPPADLRWLAIVDFTQPRGAYFFPGIAAVFLAAYGSRRGHGEALALGHKFLSLNIQGTPAQFEDTESVQICKFGWGVAAMQIADRDHDYGPELLRMADWFIAHQGPDGEWTPSSFVSPQPSLPEVMAKTAEHAMEVNAIIGAMATVTARTKIDQ